MAEKNHAAPSITREETFVQSLGKALSVATLIAGALSFGPASAKDLTFGYAANNLLYPYVVATQKGFEKEAAKVGVKTVVLDARGSVEKQGNAIDDLLTQKVDAIGFLPMNSVVSQSWADKIAAAHIPAVAISIMVGDPTKRQLQDVYPSLAAFVTTDDVAAGASSAKLAAQLLSKDHKAKIAIVEGSPGAAVSAQRIKGFKKGLADAGISYDIVASQPTDWTPDQGDSVCQNILTATPNVDLIFSLADDMAIGCARAISSMGLKTHLVATAGGAKMGNDAIASGDLYGSVCTKPELIGRLMFKQMYDAVQHPGTVKSKFVTYDAPAITKGNLSDCPPEW